MSGRPDAHRVSTSKINQPSINTSPTTLLHPSVSLSGTHPVTLGPSVIVQTRARLISTYGSLAIGHGSIVGEKASVGQSVPAAACSGHKPTNTDIGTNVLIEACATVEAALIGDATIIEAGARIGKGAVIGKHCKICAKVDIEDGDEVDNDTVVYGNRWDERRLEREGHGLRGVEQAREVMMEAQRDCLRSLWTGK